MRLNKFLSQATNLSRRSADEAIVAGRVTINENVATLGQAVLPADIVQLDGEQVEPVQEITTIILNKPVGYVCSRDGQGSDTVYDLIPDEHQHLNLVGRLDKNSSGLLILTNDGELANRLTHPSFQKEKVYEAELNRPLNRATQEKIAVQGVELEDGISKLGLVSMANSGKKWQITMSEGRNRQIRRTFEAIGNRVVKLHRTNFGKHKLGSLKSGEISVIIGNS